MIWYEAGIVSKPLNTESRKQHHAKAQGLLFYDAKGVREITTGIIPIGDAKCRRGR